MYYSKAYSDQFTISKDIDAESPIIIFFGTICIVTLIFSQIVIGEIEVYLQLSTNNKKNHQCHAKIVGVFCSRIFFSFSSLGLQRDIGTFRDIETFQNFCSVCASSVQGLKRITEHESYGVSLVL